jgi:hypothetical protein
LADQAISRRVAWLIVGLLWVVGCLHYLDRITLTTMWGGSIKVAVPMDDDNFGLLLTVRGATQQEVILLFWPASQDSLGIMPRAKVVKSAPDLLRPDSGEVGKQGEIGMWFWGLASR